MSWHQWNSIQAGGSWSPAILRRMCRAAKQDWESPWQSLMLLKPWMGGALWICKIPGSSWDLWAVYFFNPKQHPLRTFLVLKSFPQEWNVSSCRSLILKSLRYLFSLPPTLWMLPHDQSMPRISLCRTNTIFHILHNLCATWVEHHERQIWKYYYPIFSGMPKIMNQIILCIYTSFISKGVFTCSESQILHMCINSFYIAIIYIIISYINICRKKMNCKSCRSIQILHMLSWTYKPAVLFFFNLTFLLVFLRGGLIGC